MVGTKNLHFVTIVGDIHIDQNELLDKLFMSDSQDKVGFDARSFPTRFNSNT